MTGSGSAVCGIFSDAETEALEEIAKNFDEKFSFVKATTLKNQSFEIIKEF